MSADLIGDDACREAFNKARQQRFSVHGLDVVCEPDIFRAGYAAGRDSEIAKRDARMAELEKELQAGATAVENCELFRAELAAIKAQEPVAWAGAIEYGVPLLMVEPQNWKATPLYAAPVSEAKAQEPDCDRSACGDFSPGPCDNPDCSARRDRMVGAPAAKAQGVALDGSQLAGLLEQVRLDDDEAKPHGSGATYWNNAVIACQVAIRDALADHAQQVSVPDVSAMARILADRNADACNVNREDNWTIYGQDYIDDVTAMLAAAPAAPAADAELVEALEIFASVMPENGWPKDYDGWRKVEIAADKARAALAAHRSKGAV